MGKSAFEGQVDGDDLRIFGSRFWEAWADLTLGFKRGTAHVYTLAAMKDKTGRRVGQEGVFEKPMLLNLVEPTPLVFMLKDNLGQTSSKLWAHLCLDPEGLTFEEACVKLRMSRRSIESAVAELEHAGLATEADYRRDGKMVFECMNKPEWLGG